MAGTPDARVATMQHAYEAFSRGDMETLRQLWTEDVVWHVGGHNRLSGDKRGADAILAYFQQLIEATGNTLRVELHDVVANDTHVVSMHTPTAEHGGRRLNAHVVLVTHMCEGKFAEIWDHADNTQALDAFLA